MKFVKERVNVICQELARLSISQKIKITDMQVKNGCYITPAEADASKEPWTSFDTVNDRWYGPDKHYWFRTTITIPESFDGKNLWMRVHAGLDEWDDGRNPQFLLFANGELIQGMDINHREVLVRENAKAGEKIQLDLQSYTGTLHSEFRLLADLEEHDAKIEEIYYDLIVPMQGLNRMDEDNKTRLDLETALTNTINLLDLRKSYSKEFYASIEEAEKCIQEEIYEKMGGWDEVVATCIGHTHIDVAWLWTIDQVRQKSCRSFATVLKLMDEYPNYHFMSSQPKLYSFVKERHPEVYEKIRQRVKEGRWEPEGGMWVEADCNLTSGESLVRQFLFGKRFFKEEFGVDNKILWLPDVVGYSAAMPQILKKCGIDYFMTTKLAWNEFNKVPYDTMNWEGIDGSKVFTHMITTLGVGQPETSFFTTYNGMLHPDAIMGGWDRYQNKDINNDILISYGYGDGGGGPTRTMLETSKRMEKGIKGVPKVRQAFARTYFDELHEKVKDSKRLPTWIGELYFEFHRGTYTSMARNKRGNRKSEYAMMELELLSVLAEKAGKAYPTEELNRMWEMILTNQFHDILPGSSIKEVYDDSKAEYEGIFAENKALTDATLAHIAAGVKAPKHSLVVYNPNSAAAYDLVTFTVPEGMGEPAVYDGETKLAVQKTADGAYVFFAAGVPGKGYKTYNVKEEAADTTPTMEVSTKVMENEFFKVEYNEKGQFAKIYDKKAERDVLKPGEAGNVIVSYEDRPHNYDAWDVNNYYTEKSWDIDQVSAMEVVENGPVRACVKVERKYLDSTITQFIYLYHDIPRIDIKNVIDWKEHQIFVKDYFPIDVHTNEATFDIQYGNVKRDTHDNTSWDFAKFEVCHHKWMDVSEDGYGVSMLNDCKYGVGVRNGVIGMSMLKSAIHPNPEADKELHEFTYSIYPHQGGWREAGTVKQAYQINNPLTCSWKENEGGTLAPEYSLVSSDQDNAVIEVVKKAEDSDAVIVRLYECYNRRTLVTLIFGKEVTSVVECNMMEEGADPVEFTENQATFEMKPYEIKTLKVTF